MISRDSLSAIMKDVNKCFKCCSILKRHQILPRFGFPPDRKYSGMILGAEPGQKAIEHGLISPLEYLIAFSPHTGNDNKARLILEDIHNYRECLNTNWDDFFFTNTVKCPARPSESRRCFSNCSIFLHRQIKVIKPRIIITLGRAADRLGLQRPMATQVLKDTYNGYPVLSIRHPQGSTMEYRMKVIKELSRAL